MFATHHGTGTKQALALDHFEQFLHALLEGQHFRPAEFVDRARPGLAVDRIGDRGFGDVADIDRLELGLAAADQRQHRRDRAPCRRSG